MFISILSALSVYWLVGDTATTIPMVFGDKTVTPSPTYPKGSNNIYFWLSQNQALHPRKYLLAIRFCKTIEITSTHVTCAGFLRKGPYRDTIYVSEEALSRRDSCLETLDHEFAHALFKNESTEFHKKFLAIHNLGKDNYKRGETLHESGFVSEYATTNVTEDIADSYMDTCRWERKLVSKEVKPSGFLSSISDLQGKKLILIADETYRLTGTHPYYLTLKKKVTQ